MAQVPAGYSGTPLAKELGIVTGRRVVAVDAPAACRASLEPLPDGVSFAATIDGDADLVHHFVADRATPCRMLAASRASLRGDAVVWVPWPKKASKVATDLIEDVVRATRRR